MSSKNLERYQRDIIGKFICLFFEIYLDISFPLNKDTSKLKLKMKYKEEMVKCKGLLP